MRRGAGDGTKPALHASRPRASRGYSPNFRNASRATAVDAHRSGDPGATQRTTQSDP